MGLFGRKKKVEKNSSSEWTSFEFVQFLIKYPDTSDDNFVEMYSNLLGEDTLEKRVFAAQYVNSKRNVFFCRIFFFYLRGSKSNSS